jgi:hypothetical protein
MPAVIFDVHPCYFCASECMTVRIWKEGNNKAECITSTKWHAVACEECGAQGPRQLNAEDAVTAWNCGESVENIDKALQLLSKLYEKHYECEDCWYSCPKSDEGCCNEYAEDGCTCGADKHNALIDEIMNILNYGTSNV